MFYVICRGGAVVLLQFYKQSQNTLTSMYIDIRGPCAMHTVPTVKRYLHHRESVSQGIEHLLAHR